MSGTSSQIVESYRKYGFRSERKYEAKGVLVFTLQNGYFDNAEIIILATQDPACASAADQVFSDYSKAGYACTVRRFESVEQVESDLFKGFFLVESTKERLRSDYAKFTKSITATYSDDAKYQYIDSPYSLNGTDGDQSAITRIMRELESPSPTLFLIEAAAGFGKTCTAYELVNQMLLRENKLPLFSELSRNRSAKIFRYVLLDEIDRTFPQLKSKLVESEILSGRVVVVLDGFDELLRKSGEGGDFESSEPMLETIGELLQGHAKIILTTRRTVIFEGDDFHRWVEEHDDKFSIQKYRLTEPSLVDWLSDSRIDLLRSHGFDVEAIANPVLLSYLRCISDKDFAEAAADPDGLVAKYFSYMLERERVRQDLRLDVQGQLRVLKDIAKDMIELGYTSESRDYIVDLIKERQIRLLDEVRSSYAATEKPTRDEIANKLASHALLDKSSSDDSKIGFVNEFVFGSFVAENILDSADWMNDDLRFLEPAVLSYVPRSVGQKGLLRQKIDGVLEFLDWNSRILIALRLGGVIDFALLDGEADTISLENVEVGSHPVRGFQFNNCTFKACAFSLSNLDDVTFLNCKFYECMVLSGDAAGGVHVLGCIGDAELLSSLSTVGLSVESKLEAEPDREFEVDRYILEKFWPIGMLNFHRRRPIKGVCGKSNAFSPEELYAAIDRLKKRGLLFEPHRRPPAFSSGAI